jgi:hypothetical protein
MERREVTVRLDEQQFNQFDDVCHARRVKKQQALIEAITGWIDGPGTPRSSRTDQAAAPEPSEWHRKLTEILKSGDQPTIDAVTQNIDVFHDRLRPARRRKAV